MPDVGYFTCFLSSAADCRLHGLKNAPGIHSLDPDQAQYFVMPDL